ncbi:hypothetical protein D6829_00215 [Candidatus Pacearchaeota archaeon]|nr:MAG: hypothetical protein D6829_00215 [Candidatus Pacearchaeota archaeon]
MKLKNLAKNFLMALALAPSLKTQTPVTQDYSKPPQTLILFESKPKSRCQRLLLKELEKRYAGHFEKMPLRSERGVLKNEVIPTYVRTGKLKKPKQVVVLADYRSINKPTIIYLNRLVRRFDNDPFPDAKISFIPSKRGYLSELERLVQRTPYVTRTITSICDWLNPEILYAKSGINLDNLTSNEEEANLFRKENGQLFLSQKKPSLEWLVQLFSAPTDFITTTSKIQNNSSIGVFKNMGKFTIEAYKKTLRLMRKNGEFKKLSLGLNPKIYEKVESEGLLPFDESSKEDDSLLMALLSNNAYVFAHTPYVPLSNCGLNPVHHGNPQRDYFWASGSAHSFTESLLLSQIVLDLLRDPKNGNRTDRIYVQRQLDKAAYYGLPDSLTHADSEHNLLTQSERIEKSKKRTCLIYTVNLIGPEEYERVKGNWKEQRQDTEFRYLMTPPAFLIEKEIDPSKIKKLSIRINKKPLRHITTLRKKHMTKIKFYDTNFRREASAYLLDNAFVPFILSKNQKGDYVPIKRKSNYEFSIELGN